MDEEVIGITPRGTEWSLSAGLKVRLRPKSAIVVGPSCTANRAYQSRPGHLARKRQEALYRIKSMGKVLAAWGKVCHQGRSCACGDESSRSRPRLSLLLRFFFEGLCCCQRNTHIDTLYSSSCSFHWVRIPDFNGVASSPSAGFESRRLPLAIVARRCIQVASVFG